MKQGQFYFISDSFYLQHDKNKNLMQNKEVINGTAHNRPCFYSFPDTKNPDIFWCIPISSQIQKFETIANKKIENQRNRGIKNPKCNTIRFGKVLGQKRAFLIQNMFPITKKYISAEYIDKNTNNPVTIDKLTEKDILNNARDVLKLVYRGVTSLVFSDIIKTHMDLTIELQQEKSQLIPPNIQNPTGVLAKMSMKDRFTAAKEESQKRADQKQPTPKNDKKQNQEL